MFHHHTLFTLTAMFMHAWITINNRYCFISTSILLFMHMEGKWYLAMSVYILWHLASLNIYSTVCMNHRRWVHCPPEMTHGFFIVVDTHYYTCPGEGVQEFPRVDPQKHGLWSQLGQVGGCSLSGYMLSPCKAPSSCSGHALSGFCCISLFLMRENILLYDDWLIQFPLLHLNCLYLLPIFPLGCWLFSYQLVGNFYIRNLDPRCLHTWLLSPPRTWPIFSLCLCCPWSPGRF